VVGLDTNVMLRILLAPDPRQPQSEELARRARAAATGGEIFLSDIVLGEIENVLCRHYDMSREAIIAALDKIFANPGVTIQDRPLALAAWRDYKAHSGVGLADCLILSKSRSHSARLATFDKKLARLSGARLV
jgi:predicted nucleic-acid-binding protein